MRGRRRRFLAAAVAIAAAPRARSQQAGLTYRVGLVLAISPLAEMKEPNPVHPITRAIVHELRALGYVEGRNLSLERRSAEGNPERYRDIFAELLAARTDVLIVAGDRALIRAAQAATSSVPMVLINYPTPVEDGSPRAWRARAGTSRGPPAGQAGRTMRSG